MIKNFNKKTQAFNDYDAEISKWVKVNRTRYYLKGDKTSYVEKWEDGSFYNITINNYELPLTHIVDLEKALKICFEKRVDVGDCMYLDQHDLIMKNIDYPTWCRNQYAEELLKKVSK